jgi:hypothetical protein
LAFLKYNYSPAVIFAGDTGSLFFGTTAAILSVKLGTLSGEGVETLSMFYIVALPVTEVFVSMIRRYAYGRDNNKSMREKIKMMMTPDNRHMHHRLINKGYTHERALFFLMAYSVLFALCSILLTLSQNIVMKVIVCLYSIFVFLRIIDYMDYGKGFLKFRNRKNIVEKYVLIFTDNKCFEESLISAVDENYMVEKFDIIDDEYKRKNIESFVIYNDGDGLIERDIEKIYEIRALFNTAIFFVSTEKNLKKYSYILEREKNVYFAEKPCDITMLVHNISKISYSGEIQESIYLDENREESNDASKS